MTDTLLTFIQSYAHWAIVIAFLIAFFESLAIIGLFMPGWALLFGMGALIGSNQLDLYSILIGVYLGAVVGEYLSFHLGFYYHERVLSWSWVAKHQKMINGMQAFFDKHGVSGVFVGRFLGPSRAVVPFIAGVSKMNKTSFFWVNILSAILWAPFYVFPGMLVGAAFALDKSVAYQLILILSVVAIATYWLFKYNLEYWKQIKSPQKKSSIILVKAALSLGILLAMIVIIYRSSYWHLIKQIGSIILDKL
jgi:membrane protein DedA with SNARE-associated domain